MLQVMKMPQMMEMMWMMNMWLPQMV